MKLYTLGRLELEGASFQRAKSLLLLTYLSLRGKQSREHLAELFWPKGKPRQRRNNLSKALSDLRKHAPGSFESDKTNVWTFVSTDVAEFREAVAVKDYAGAANIYQGSFFVGHMSGWSNELEEWLFEQRDRLAEEAQEALLLLAEQRALDDSTEALHYARSAFRLTEPQVELLPRFYTLFAGRDTHLTLDVRDLARGYGVALQSFPGGVERDQAEQAKKPTPPNLSDRGTSSGVRNVELGEITRQLLRPGCKLLSLVGTGGTDAAQLFVQRITRGIPKRHPKRWWLIGVSSLSIIAVVVSSSNWSKSQINETVPDTSAELFSTEVRVSQSSDDAEESVVSGAMYIDSSDLELVEDPDGNILQIVGIRFQGVDIPQGATVSDAHIEFEVDGLDDVSTSLIIHGEAADSAGTFSSLANDASSRSRTAAAVAWDEIAAWTRTGEKYQTPSLTPIVQEIVDRSGWFPGNSMAFIITGSGDRTAEAYDGEPERAPLLRITYTLATTD